MFLGPLDSLELSLHGVYGPFETNLFKKIIKRGDVVLDIGAHIGYYTLIAAKLVGENGKVYAFEPDPDNFALLKKNIEWNGYKNVILVNKAVSNQNGKTKLFLQEGGSVDHQIYDSHEGRKSVIVDVITLDDFFFKNEATNINLIKMDIQGAEAGAVQGMAHLLEKSKNVTLVTEFWPNGLRRFGSSAEEYLKILEKHGFKLYNINDREGKIEPVEKNHLLKIYPVEKGYATHTNLLCLKKGIGRKWFYRE